MKEAYAQPASFRSDLTRTEARLPSWRHGPVHRADDGRTDRKSSRFVNNLRFERTGWKVLVVLVLVSGLTVSFVSAWAWYAYTSTLSHQAVASSLADVKSILGTTLERDSDLLATVNAEVATHPRLNNAALAALLSKLDLAQRYPGSFAFTYIENVSRASLPRFEAITRQDPSFGLKVRGRAPVKASLNGRSGYCLTRLVAVEMLGEGILKNVLLAWITPYVSSSFNFCASSFARSSTPRPKQAYRWPLPSSASYSRRPACRTCLRLSSPCSVGSPSSWSSARSTQVPLSREPSTLGPMPSQVGRWPSSMPTRS